MADVDTLVSGIEYKIHKLIEHLQSQEKINEHLQKEIHELNIQREEKYKKIKDLEENLKICKTTTPNTNTETNTETKEGTVEAKAKINELLREIEHCIGLLNR